MYCKKLAHISIPPASIVSKTKSVPTIDGDVGLPAPVNDQVVPDIALPLIDPLLLDMFLDEVILPLVELLPVGVMVPLVVVLPLDAFPIL